MAETVKRTRKTATEVAKTTPEVTEEEAQINQSDYLKANMIKFANELIEQLRGKQITGSEYIGKIIDIYNAVK